MLDEYRRYLRETGSYRGAKTVRRTAAHVESNARGSEWVNHDRYAESLLENAKSCRAIGEAEKADKYEAEAQRLKRIGEKGYDICQKFAHPVKFRVQRGGLWALGITVGLVVAGIVGTIIGWLQVSLFTLSAQANGGVRTKRGLCLS